MTCLGKPSIRWQLIIISNFRQLKGSLIGSNRQKHLIVERGILPRLIHLLGNPESSCELQVAVAQTLGSVAKGMETHLKALIDCGAIPVLLNCLLRSTNKKMTEACLCCLKTTFIHPEVSRNSRIHTAMIY